MQKFINNYWKNHHWRKYNTMTSDDILKKAKALLGNSTQSRALGTAETRARPSAKKLLTKLYMVGLVT